MRPDRHKQAASRRYQSKVKARGGSIAASASGGGGPGTHHGRMTRLQSHNAEQDASHNDTGEMEEEEHGFQRRYARRKVVSNLDRYVEETEEVNEAEELEKGIDRQTMAFEELLLDSDQKHSFDQAAYFRFKSEKAAEDLEAAGAGHSLTADDNQHSQRWMEIRLDDLEASLMRLPLTERLYLSQTDQRFFEYDEDDQAGDYATSDEAKAGGKVSFQAGTPIVPKLVRGEAAVDILIQSSSGNKGGPSGSLPVSTEASVGPQPAASLAPGIKQLSNTETRRQQAKASKDQELDDLLEQSRRTVVSIRDLPRAQPAQATPASTTSASTQAPKPTSRSQAVPGSSSVTVSLAKQPLSSSPLPTPSAARKVPLPVPGKPSPSLPRPGSKLTTPSKPAPKSGANLDDEWLDSMLG